MKHRIKLIVLSSFIFLIFIPKSIYSSGFGLYISPFNKGNSTVNWDDEFVDTDNWPIKYWGFGFVYDTRIADATSASGTFNYRLNIGLEVIEYKEKHNEGYIKDSYGRLKLDNTFGFGIIHSGLLHLWFGPQLRLAIEGFPGNYETNIGDGRAWGIGIAPLIGFDIDINLNNIKSISFDLGYRVNYYSGSGARGSGVTKDYIWDSTITEEEIFFNISIFWIEGFLF